MLFSLLMLTASAAIIEQTDWDAVCVGPDISLCGYSEPKKKKKIYTEVCRHKLCFYEKTNRSIKEDCACLDR